MNTHGLCFGLLLISSISSLWHACLLVRVSYRMSSVFSSALLRTKALACLVLARVPVPSPFYPKSHGQSHLEQLLLPCMRLDRRRLEEGFLLCASLEILNKYNLWTQIETVPCNRNKLVEIV